ncbi:uncharacterized protein LOC121370256 [Gigantopelta aegis]|uniref:uncharacterized protein LOC121370256 n=1 Tax=Gigantopelta aegis TaxID=1735272 RepID=UPI001B88CFD8|nr:uncharacterized protein LOC121370256 [Gigantopelta aegis]
MTQSRPSVLLQQRTAVVVADVQIPNLEFDALEFIDVATQQSAEPIHNKPEFRKILRDLKSCEDVVVNGVLSSSVIQRFADVCTKQSSLTSPAVPRHRRKSHIKAEQQRRKKIYTHLWVLVDVIPSLAYLKNARNISELDVVNETLKCVNKLKAHHDSQTQRIHDLKKESKECMEMICDFQASLPAGGLHGCLTPRSLDDMFAELVTQRSSAHWTYWIFSFFR